MMTTFLIYDCLSANSFLTQQYTRRTWKADDAERRAEEEDRVADVVEVEVLDAGKIMTMLTIFLSKVLDAGHGRAV